jgi:hypothetical protein
MVVREGEDQDTAGALGRPMTKVMAQGATARGPRSVGPDPRNAIVDQQVA